MLSSNSPAQISPGDLTKAHSNLEGISNCTKCHVLGEKVTESKCLNCHTEISALIKSGRGYHSNSEVKKKECWSCHSEHHGRNFRIVNFNKDNFEHSLTGFELTGKHNIIECTGCHKSALIKNEKLKSKSFTYLGLDTECSSCHEDVHQGSLGKNCSGCHTTEKFIPAQKFDHNKSAFKLTGAHLNTPCEKCHKVAKTKSGGLFRVYKPVQHGSCSSCHTDPHNNKLGSSCSSCHSTVSFGLISSSSFDHAKTGFALIGMHNKVQCSSCHKDGISVKLNHEKCTDCHSDYHRGEFYKNGRVTDCSSCHNEYGFKPSLFNIERHNQLKFKLTGSHLAVPCISCHYKSEQWRFSEIGTGCINCHQNVHGNEIRDIFMPDNNCASCHSVDNWITISFEHNRTEFPLLGKHEEVECKNCHASGKPNEAKEYKFASLSSECTTCHKDIHNGQFIQNSGGCLQCHSFNDWRPMKFDHNKTKFPLKGAHERVLCSKCHKLNGTNGSRYILYKLEDFKCAACHS